MRVDANFYGTVPMPDAGYEGPKPVDRRYGNDDYLACYDNLLHWSTTMDRLGYDTMWLTEHHFQYEGYEVTPNLILFGLHLAKATERLRLGQMFNVVPQWHPLRLAEDAAMMQILTDNRIQFGVGRGTVPREAQSLGGIVASGDNEMSREADALNREIFQESMEVIKAAWTNERFSFKGEHFEFPPPGIPDRGSTVQDLTLVPKPIAPIEIWQAVTSPPTLDYCARVRHSAVIPGQGIDGTIKAWTEFGDKAAANGWDIGRSDGRCLAIPMHVGRTTQEAKDTFRNAHDEWIRFLSPYGRFRFYTLPDGSPPPFDFQPTLEDSITQDQMIIGSPEECADVIGRYREQVGVEHFVMFYDLPGLTREQMDFQLETTANEVLPKVGVTLDGPEAPPTDWVLPEGVQQ
jgi:alkanesulfonate monooxygenase SsuD/methylene tetrahydromethanopterin reductase-like flavin-dependent oxidoreductase (luciferase family)